MAPAARNAARLIDDAASGRRPEAEAALCLADAPLEALMSAAEELTLAGFGSTVTYSRKVLSSPTSTRVKPPVHFKSCVFNPMLANGKISLRAPSVVCPSMTTCE